ncbi:Na(+)/H(+) exchange regulatory cofactor NHE-RF4 isoform X4 [Rissa tridactyla]|uniref:Na(+)/H(+) exchange regulatory cofactor NHE-RF4 isoform X4 n=1 Tax=Rissa tridactyla TaxID=75485 RepID=UPI0023BAAD63|nr:Na(+)/H(+) exchange regulatory cofactor NHE-RF4 isoform X4 [Rissa tridactyla]
MKQTKGLEGDKKSIIKFEFNPKDGIDNPALSLAEDTDGEGVGEPRFYLLSKDSTETFGFCLHEELGCQGHVIRQVELGGLAQRRGLQDGDRLLQVNGHFVDHMDHRTVVQKIKASGNQVLLAVLDGGSYEAAKVLGRDLSQMLPADIRPRLCHITRDRSGFGFSVSGPEGVKGTFQLSVRQDGPAERAGVPPGSWLLELNGASVRSYSHAQLARKLKQSGNKVTLLVASSAVEEFYRLRGLQITAALADTSWLPFKVRELHMVKGPAGYGFLLKEDDCISGAIGQFLWDVDAGLPAEQAGMKEGDRLLAVNEPAPGGAQEAAPGILAAQDHPASGQALPYSASTQAISSPMVPPARLPRKHGAAQHGCCMHSCCVSMPRMGLTAPRDSSPLAKAGSKLLLTTVMASCNLKTDMCVFACPATSRGI